MKAAAKFTNMYRCSGMSINEPGYEIFYEMHTQLMAPDGIQSLRAQKCTIDVEDSGCSLLLVVITAIEAWVTVEAKQCY